MKEIIGLSQEDFFRWIKLQLEKRDVLNRKLVEAEKVKEELYEILFYEQGLTAEDIEYYFIPFGQAGYLTSRQKFEIMTYVLQKEYGSSLIVLKGTEKYCVFTEDDVEELYLTWTLEERLYLSQEDKKDFFVQGLLDRLGLGVVELLKRVAPDGFLIGELCPADYENEAIEERVAICSQGTVIRLPFLALENKEELIRIIKYIIAMENRGELTMMDPIMDFVREDGTCITAVRPPARKDWGIRVLYGAAGKEEPGWRN